MLRPIFNNVTTPLSPQNRRTHMVSFKPVEEASQDFTADLAALRDDVEN
jgi:hypothetical protein